MAHNWKTTRLETLQQVYDVLVELARKRWMSRGQSKHYDKNLLPSIERHGRHELSRLEKLKLERRSINTFRSAAKFFAEGEKHALHDDIVALIVLRHYGVPTRLLDWSHSPFVAAYFTVANKDHDEEDGELWSFDRLEYQEVGKKQWRCWPQTTTDGTGDPGKFDPRLTAFIPEEPPPWFVCQFYESIGFFPRQDAQSGAYSLTARFNIDHSEAIEKLFDGNDSRYHLYTVSSMIKPDLRQFLREKHGISRDPLFPDSAGAAETAGSVFPQLK